MAPSAPATAPRAGGYLGPAGYDVTRRQVWFDEVLLVTYHQTIGWASLVAMLFFLGLLGFFGVMILIGNPTTATAVTSGILMLPFALSPSGCASS